MGNLFFFAYWCAHDAPTKYGWSFKNYFFQTKSFLQVLTASVVQLSVPWNKMSNTAVESNGICPISSSLHTTHADSQSVSSWKWLTTLLVSAFVFRICSELLFGVRYSEDTKTEININIAIANVADSSSSERSKHSSEDSSALCLYDTANNMNDGLLSAGIGHSGFWVNLSSNSCLNADGESACKGDDLWSLYDFNIDQYSVFRMNEHCVYRIYKPLDIDLLRCLSNRNVLFLGDSTMEYMVYYSLILDLLNTTSLFEDHEHIEREFEISNQQFLGKYNISVHFRWASGWPSIHNNHGTETFEHHNIWDYIDKRYLQSGSISHIVFHSLFHDITHRTIYELETNHKNISLEQHLREYTQRMSRIIIGLLQRIEYRARESDNVDDDDYMLYLWTSTRVGNAGDLEGLCFLMGRPGYFEWFNDFYDDYLDAMVLAANVAMTQHPEYKDHFVFVDTSSFSADHRNMYYGDGLHYGSGEYRDGIKRSPIVRNMMMNAVLNEICLRPRKGKP